MPSWKKVITSGSDASLASLSVTGGINSLTISSSAGITGSDVYINDWGSISASLSAFVAAGGTVDGTGTTNYISKWSDLNTLTDSVVYDNGTNVGIGTTNPLYQLHVEDTSTQAPVGLYIKGSDRSVKLQPYAFGGNGQGLTGPTIYHSANNSSATSVRFAAINGNGTVSYFQLWDDGEANTLALRTNSTNANTLRIYNSFTNSTNYERAGLTWDSNTFTIKTEASGSGSGRNLLLQGGSNLTSQGNLLLSTGLVSIGYRALSLGHTSKTILYSPSEGILRLSNDTSNDFTRLTFGGVSTSYPGIERNGTSLEVRLADGSDFTDLYAKNLYLSNDLIVTGSTTVRGDLTVDGVVTAKEFHTQFVSASIIYQSGSTKFGDTLDDKHEFTGSIQQSGSNSYFLGNVGIGTTSPSTLLHIVRSTNGEVLRLRDTSHINQDYVFETESTGTFYGLNIKNNNTGLSLLNISADQKIGIATNNPLATLHLNKSAANTYQLLIGGSNGLGLGSDPSGQIRHIIGSAYGNAATMMSFTLGGYTTASDKMTILGSGNVGIGTTSPERTLHLNSSANNYIRLETSITNGYAGIEFKNDAKTWTLGLNNTDSFVLAPSVQFGGGYPFEVEPAAYNDSFVIKSGGDIITNIAGGNFGIGTTSPSYKLDVSGSGNFTNGLTVTGSILHDGDLTVTGTVTAQGEYFYGDSTTPYLRLSTAGGAVLGYSTSTLTNGGSLQFQTSGGVKFRINSGGGGYVNGNFGLSNTNPTEALDVIGNGLISGDLTVGGVVTAKEFHTEFVSASIVYQSGSTKFGDTSDDTHEFTGSIQQSGSNSYFLGNVGIGTTSPDSLLTLTGNNVIKFTGVSAQNQISTIQTDSSDNLSITAGLGSGKSITIGIGGRNLRLQSSAFTYRNEVHDFRDFLNVPQLYIDSTGNNPVKVGIGTTTPTQKLHVVGNISGSDSYIDDWGSVSASLASISSSAATIPTFQQVTDQGASTTNQLLISNGTITNPAIAFSADSNTGIYRSAENVIGISAGGIGYLFDGSTFSSGQLYMRRGVGTASAPNYSFGSGYDTNGMYRPSGVNELAFSTAGVEALRIDSSQNIGIGTTSPSKKLHVSGSARFDSTTSIYQSSDWNGLEIFGYDDQSSDYLKIHIGTTPMARYQSNLSHNFYVGNSSIFSIASDTVSSTVRTKLADDIVAMYGTNNDTYLGYSNTDNKFKIGFTPLSTPTVDSNTIFSLDNSGVDITGNLTVSGIVTAQEFHTEFVSASIVYQSGSTKFGDTYDDVHQFTGSIQQSGSNSYFLGRVGIGTTAPSYPLHIVGTSAGQGYAQIENTVHVSRLYLKSSTQIGSITMDGTGGAISGGGLLFNTSNSRTHFMESDVPKMSIIAGNVGIGTTSPSYKLDVVGDLRVLSSSLSYQENIDVDSAAAEVVATVTLADYDCAFFDYLIKSGSNLRAGTVTAIHDGTNVEYNEVSTQDLGSTIDVELSVDISGTDLRLLATTASDNWTVKSLIRTL